MSNTWEGKVSVWKRGTWETATLPFSPLSNGNVCNFTRCLCLSFLKVLCDPFTPHRGRSTALAGWGSGHPTQAPVGLLVYCVSVGKPLTTLDLLWVNYIQTIFTTETLWGGKCPERLWRSLSRSTGWRLLRRTVKRRDGVSKWHFCDHCRCVLSPSPGSELFVPDAFWGQILKHNWKS